MIALGTPAELKNGLTEHSLLNLEASDPLETMRALEGLPGVHDVAVFGGGLHITVDERGDGQAARSASGWRRRASRCARLEPIQPSMEDVFVAMIEAEERKAA